MTGGLNVSTGLPATPTMLLDPAMSSPGGPRLSKPNRGASMRFASAGEGGAPGSSNSGGGSGNRSTNRYSVTALYSMAAEQDTEIEDELAKGGCFPRGDHAPAARGRNALGASCIALKCGQWMQGSLPSTSQQILINLCYPFLLLWLLLPDATTIRAHSPEAPARAQSAYIEPVKEELRP